LDRELIAQIVREVREEIVQAEWVTVRKLSQLSGVSTRKIHEGFAKGQYRTRLDGGLRMVHLPTWNKHMENCPETNPRPSPRQNAGQSQ
jgi:hypothetical protein